jgi:fucose 4-O-acetylase-like acetyltransferase
MPAFILISGFFAKGIHKKGYLKKITKKLIVPYLIFQGIYSIYYFFIHENNGIYLDPLVPQWSLWFLISLFCWNIMLYFFTKWKTSVALFLSIALGVAVGYFEEINSFLSLSRTFVFFPFFLIGYYLKKEYFEMLRNVRIKFISLFVLVSIFAIVYLLPEFDYKWLYGSKPYTLLDSTQLNGGIIRLGVYALTSLATLSFLALVPKEKYFFTKWGMSSIYVYLLHGFFIKYFRNSELVEILKDSQQIFIIIFISIVLTAFLSSKIIRKIAQPLIELKTSFSFLDYIRPARTMNGHEAK